MACVSRYRPGVAKPDAPKILRKGDEVVCAHDLREVPEGTEGKVILVVGLSWIRYWVRFANGVAVGSVNRKDLATPDEWAYRLEHPDEVAAEGAADDDEADAGGDDGGGGGGGYTRAGVLVPQLLLDRSKAARERLGA
ncbi:hypothetical protein BH24ACT4_BH24ACT4_05110 [soil metagenome]